MNDALVTACFHEAGHAIAAFYLGYSCDHIKVDDKGNGAAIIDYGGDEDTAIAIIYNRPPEEFHIPDPEKECTIALKVCRILISGIISEYILEHFRGNEPEIKILYNGPDFAKVNHISKKYGFNLEHEIHAMHELLRTEELWSAIKMLVYHLICKRTVQLNQYEIASVLKEYSFSNVAR